MTGPLIYGTLLLGGFAVLQSTVLSFLEIAGGSPDLVLIGVLFLANRNGTMVGQVAGFAAGLVLDVMGLAPLGFYSLIFLILGALFGVTRGKMFVDPIFIPVLIAVIAGLLKALLALIVAGVFGIEGVRDAVFSAPYAIELVYTGLLAPVIFGLLRMMSFIQPDRRRGEFAG
jgi:rod shape-determining protein MreD